MFNLSDKELDRLSQEAASAYDPGEPEGAGSWKMLERRLDKELGKISPSPFRGFRRISLYFAPAVILLVGVSYYFIKQGKNNTRSIAIAPAAPLIKRSDSSVGPPGTVIRLDKTGSASKETTTLTENNSDKSNSTPDSKTSAEPNAFAATPTPSTINPSTSAARTMTPSTGKESAAPSAHLLRSAPGISSNTRGKGGKGHGNDQGHDHGNDRGPTVNPAGRSGNQPADRTAGQAAVDQSSGNQASSHDQAGPHHASDPVLSPIRRPYSLSGKPAIDDSALRHITAKTIQDPIAADIKKKDRSLHIDKSLQLGFSIAPDFASVNSLAGDKPGSSIGITADYQFANRWYIGTGLLFSKRNFSARSQDYHVPQNYYGMNNMHDVNFIKGSFRMLEIPLNLRYDFSVSGNTAFFASAGLSSYLLSRENCNYYYSFFGREVYRKFSYQGDQTHMFSVVNLSLGLETGLSNSFSLLVAPYVKIPAGKLGFGQVQMNSIGINFALKYTPVLKRKRK